MITFGPFTSPRDPHAIANLIVAASRVPRDLDSDTGRGWKRPRVEVVSQSV